MIYAKSKSTLLSLLLLVLQLVPILTAPIEHPQQLVFPQLGSSSFSKLPLYFEDLSISQLKEGLSNGLYTSEELTIAYLERIDKFKDINSIISLNPFAVFEARAADRDRRRKEGGSLLGIPFLVKDNIASEYYLNSKGVRMLKLLFIALSTG